MRARLFFFRATAPLASEPGRPTGTGFATIRRTEKEEVRKMYDEYGEYDERTDLRMGIDDMTEILEIEVEKLRKTIDEKTDREVMDELVRISEIVNRMQADVGELIQYSLWEEEDREAGL